MTTEQVPIKPFFQYYGGKYRLAPKYPKPIHDTIIEPFAGAAGYSVRYYWHNVNLIDSNPQIVGTWQYLIRVKPSEIIQLPIKFDDIRHVPNICQEAKWLIGWWINLGTAEAGHKRTARSRQIIQQMREGDYSRANITWTDFSKRRIARQLKYIRHWKAFLSSYDKTPNIEATWFVDPPYHKSGDRYHGFKQLDFGRIGTWCKSLKGQVIVCEQSGATWLPFKFLCENPNAQKAIYGTGKPATEVIWYREHNNSKHRR